jgi:hypothetical protein
MTHIENSERGITLSKQLAWAIVVAIMTGGTWVGTELRSVVRAMGQFETEVRALEAADTQTELRVRDLERGAARDEAMQANTARILGNIEQKLTRIEERLRRQETSRQ